MADKKKMSMMDKAKQFAEDALNDTTGEYSEKEKNWARKLQKANADLEALKNQTPEEIEAEKQKSRKNFYAYALGVILGLGLILILKHFGIL